MLRISLPWILQAMASIDRLQQIKAGQTVHDISYLCFDAGQDVENILGQSVYSPHLKISREKAELLKAALDAMSPSRTCQQREVSELDAWTIQYHGNQFKEILMAELGILPAFLVTEKEGYDVNVLIDAGHKLFPSSTLAKCPEAGWDMSEAGKALAFELATACGFHVFRVTEAVLRRYWPKVSEDAAPPIGRTIGGFAKELEKKKLGEARIWETLKQLAELHRNPLVHPDVVLSVEDAIKTLGVARSAMGAMLQVLPDVAPTTVPQENP